MMGIFFAIIGACVGAIIGWAKGYRTGFHVGQWSDVSPEEFRRMVTQELWPRE